MQVLMRDFWPVLRRVLCCEFDAGFDTGFDASLMRFLMRGFMMRV